jgi:CRP-like cAMP-binding protein
MQTTLPSSSGPPREPGGPPTLRSANDWRDASPAAPGWLTLFGPPALPQAEQMALAGIARTRSVASGGTVFDRRDIASALVLLNSGDVALGYCGSDGVFHIERPVRGPAWLDQSAAWLQQTHAMDARASSPSLVVELPCDAVRAQIDRWPTLARHLVTSLAHEVHSLSTNTHDLMHKDAPARFAAWLAQRLEVCGGDGGRALVHLAERKRDIASQLAITPETLSRVMRSLAVQGVIAVAGYSVQVLDTTALRRIAAGA